jgi:hypothetical protein
MSEISVNREPMNFVQYLKLDSANVNDFDFLAEDEEERTSFDTLLVGNDIKGSATSFAVYCSSSTGVLLKITADSDWEGINGLLIEVPAGESATFNYTGLAFSTLSIGFLSDYEAEPAVEKLSIFCTGMV